MNVAVLGLEAPVFSLLGHRLGDESLLAVLLGNAAAEELGRALYDGSDLRELRQLGLATFFFVVSLGVQDGAHAQQLQISLEFRGQNGLWEVEPLGSRCGLFLRDIES